jgi:3,4-dihydroxy 2-butanone 4-phosphate synthase/GTP cyclohydrolase II
MALQAKGADIVEAGQDLGHPEDARDYGDATKILKLLGVKSVRLLTNNPNKLNAFDGTGINAVRATLEVPPNRYNRQYLQAKRDKMGHMLELRYSMLSIIDIFLHYLGF